METLAILFLGLFCKIMALEEEWPVVEGGHMAYIFFIFNPFLRTS